MTTPCTRFEPEGLLALVRGEALDEHFETCAACRARRAAYEGMVRDLGALGADARPPADYRAQVWARIAERRAPRRYGRWVWLVPIPVLAAVALLLLVSRSPGSGERPLLRYTITPRPDAPPMRGELARPGNLLSLQATTADARVAELRVYRGDRQLVLRCATEPPCERRDGRLSATVTLDGRGDYHVLLLTSDAPLPAPLPALSRDIAAAEQAGAAVERGQLLVVR